MQLLIYLFFILAFIMIFKRIINAVKKESQNAKIYFIYPYIMKMQESKKKLQEKSVIKNAGKKEHLKNCGKQKKI